MKIHTSCPHCNNRIGCVRKILVVSTRRNYECPYCHTKLKLKAMGAIPTWLILLSMLLNIFLYPRYITRNGFAHINFFLIAVLILIRLVLPFELLNDDLNQ